MALPGISPLFADVTTGVGSLIFACHVCTPILAGVDEEAVLLEITRKPWKELTPELDLEGADEGKEESRLQRCQRDTQFKHI